MALYSILAVDFNRITDDLLQATETSFPAPYLLTSGNETRDICENLEFLQAIKYAIDCFRNQRVLLMPAAHTSMQELQTMKDDLASKS